MTERLSEIESCLAYRVLNDPVKHLGHLSASNLKSYLAGATYRAVLKTDAFPAWKIDGVFICPEFCQSEFNFDITTQTSSVSENRAENEPDSLLDRQRQVAESWHLKNGIDKSQKVSIYYYSSLKLERRESEFWQMFLVRPVMHYGDTSSWGLYCFLNGLIAGGDWLGLPSIPRARYLMNRIQQKSLIEFGDKMEAFHSEAGPRALLDWSRNLVLKLAFETD